MFSSFLWTGYKLMTKIFNRMWDCKSAHRKININQLAEFYVKQLTEVILIHQSNAKARVCIESQEDCSQQLKCRHKPLPWCSRCGWGHLHPYSKIMIGLLWLITRSLLMFLGKQQGWPKYLGPCHSGGRLAWHSWHLASVLIHTPFFFYLFSPPLSSCLPTCFQSLCF